MSINILNDDKQLNKSEFRTRINFPSLNSRNLINYGICTFYSIAKFNYIKANFLRMINLQFYKRFYIH